MLRLEGEPLKTGGEVVTMWIPTPSMTLLQRTLLYGSCVVALLNSVGLLVLIVQQNQQRSQLEQTESRLTQLEQSSLVEFLQEVPKGAGGAVEGWRGAASVPVLQEQEERGAGEGAPARASPRGGRASAGGQAGGRRGKREEGAQPEA
ncbi:hypothetical protein FQA47_011156 [Oryzias melastigma]|uniref:Uncharacterized protein n=1 Tax=Oryzias melastigma TaxID=30732 RepID=A0A834FF72_ORYME|nr:hypothetical protein FQA47_011156 [Oryzias melastigma]